MKMCLSIQYVDMTHDVSFSTETCVLLFALNSPKTMFDPFGNHILLMKNNIDLVRYCDIYRFQSSIRMTDNLRWCVNNVFIIL